MDNLFLLVPLTRVVWRKQNSASYESSRYLDNKLFSVRHIHDDDRKWKRLLSCRIFSNNTKWIYLVIEWVWQCRIVKRLLVGRKILKSSSGFSHCWNVARIVWQSLLRKRLKAQVKKKKLLTLGELRLNP